MPRRWPGRRAKQPGRPADVWQQVLERHFTTPGSGPEPADPPGVRTLRLRHVVIASCATFAVLLGGAGYLGFLARENHDTADRWRDRSVLLQELVADRTRALNRQTARLNVASRALTRSQGALRRSEADAEELADRQRQLASEKAQVEDERAYLEAEADRLAAERSALIDVAQGLESCNSALARLFDDVALGVDPAYIDTSSAESNCSAADAAISDYVASFSGE